MKKNSGFTLVEMIVTIASLSIVCAAAALLMLSTMRMNHALTATAQKQFTVKMIGEAMDALSDKAFTIEGNTVRLESNDYLKISGDKLYLNNTEILDSVESFSVYMDNSIPHLLHYSIELAGDSTPYVGSVYCPLAN